MVGEPGGRAANRITEEDGPLAEEGKAGGQRAQGGPVFAATLAVESAVHFLDLTVGLPSAPKPKSVVRSTWPCRICRECGKRAQRAPGIEELVSQEGD